MPAAIQDRLQIADVFLVDSQIQCDLRQIIKGHETPLGCQFRNISIEDGARLYLDVDDPSKGQMIHFNVKSGMRFLVSSTNEPLPSEFPTDKELDETGKLKQFAKIDVTFVAQYVVLDDEEVSDEDWLRFKDTVRFHVTPYLREFLQSTCLRMNLPTIPLPMQKWKPGEKKGD